MAPRVRGRLLRRQDVPARRGEAVARARDDEEAGQGVGEWGGLAGEEEEEEGPEVDKSRGGVRLGRDSSVAAILLALAHVLLVLPALDDTTEPTRTSGEA